MGDFRAGVRTLATQGLQPLGRVMLQFAQLFVANGTILKLVRRSGQVDAKLLRCGLGTHGGAGWLLMFFSHVITVALSVDCPLCCA